MRTGPGIVCRGQEMGLNLSYHEKGFTPYNKARIAHGRFSGKQVVYLWARRVGDCLEVE